MFDGLLDSTRPRCERVKTGSNRRKSKSWVRDGGINSANDNLFANQTFTIDKLEPPRACVWIGSREIEVFGYRGHGLWWETTRSDTGQISGFAGCRCVLKPRLIQLRSPEWTIPMIRWPCIHLEDRIAPKPALENWHRALCQWTRLFPRRMFFFLRGKRRRRSFSNNVYTREWFYPRFVFSPFSIVNYPASIFAIIYLCVCMFS